MTKNGDNGNVFPQSFHYSEAVVVIKQFRIKINLEQILDSNIEKLCVDIEEEVSSRLEAKKLEFSQKL